MRGLPCRTAGTTAWLPWGAVSYRHLIGRGPRLCCGGRGAGRVHHDYLRLLAHSHVAVLRVLRIRHLQDRDVLILEWSLIIRLDQIKR